jgi:hypothetical protein
LSRIIRVIKWKRLNGCIVWHYGEEEKAYASKILVGKSEGERSLERDNDDNNNNDINNDTSSILYLFECLLNSPKANYKVSTIKEMNKRNTSRRQPYHHL